MAFLLMAAFCAMATQAAEHGTPCGWGGGWYWSGKDVKT